MRRAAGPRRLGDPPPVAQRPVDHVQESMSADVACLERAETHGEFAGTEPHVDRDEAELVQRRDQQMFARRRQRDDDGVDAMDPRIAHQLVDRPEDGVSYATLRQSGPRRRRRRRRCGGCPGSRPCRAQRRALGPAPTIATTSPRRPAWLHTRICRCRTTRPAVSSTTPPENQRAADGPSAAVIGSIREAARNKAASVSSQPSNVWPMAPPRSPNWSNRSALGRRRNSRRAPPRAEPRFLRGASRGRWVPLHRDGARAEDGDTVEPVDESADYCFRHGVATPRRPGAVRASATVDEVGSQRGARIMRQCFMETLPHGRT